MAGIAAPNRGASPAGMPRPETATILNAVVDPLLVVAHDGAIRYANLAAEQFFDVSAAILREQRLQEVLPVDSPIFTLIEQVATHGSVVSEYGVTVDAPRIGTHFVAIQVSPVAEMPDAVLVSLREQSIARQIDRQLTHRNAARSVTAMAVVLAHEIKNPLSGIRGAAQLLEQNASNDDRLLTQLICDETDRVCDLVDSMEAFSDKRPIERAAVNIHEVLEHVRRLAQSGFARKLRFKEAYDPSLPPVFGNRDQLVQVFLNLVKNAAEAVAEEDGEIGLHTAYRHSVRLAVPGSESRLQLPLEISVRDNGHGIPEDLRGHLFDPFVTTKAGGTGLGLALVAKIIGDHGGVIAFDSEPRRTVFRINLPTDPTASGAR